MDEARQRVEAEINELGTKITNLTNFLYTDKHIKANISIRMRNLMAQQLRAMREYSECLFERLAIWGKSDDELDYSTGYNPIRK